MKFEENKKVNIDAVESSETPASKKLGKKFYLYTICPCVVAIAAAIVLFSYVLIPTTFDITLNDDGKIVHATTTEKTVGAFLESHGITLANDDEIDTDISSDIYNGMEIVINRAVSLTVVSGGEEIALRMLDGTVDDALKTAGIEVASLDEVSPSLDTELSSGMTISHVNVEIKYEYVEEKIPYESITEKDSSLLKGTKKVVQKGTPGIKQNKVEVVYKDGEVFSKTVIESKITKEPKSKITHVGTGNTVKATITYYCACEKCCGKYSYQVDGVTYSKTASGKKIYNGMPDPHWIAANFGSFGDKVVINGTTYTIVDRLGSSFSGTYRVDIFTPEGHSQCERLGRKRNVSIKLLDV